MLTLIMNEVQQLHVWAEVLLKGCNLNVSLFEFSACYLSFFIKQLPMLPRCVDELVLQK